MAELKKEADVLICRESCHHYDPEDPPEAHTPSSIREEKRQLLKKCSQKGKRYFGKHIPLLWRKDEPILTLGPHCNFSNKMNVKIP